MLVQGKTVTIYNPKLKNFENWNEINKQESKMV